MVRNITKLSLLSGQRCWRDHPGLVQTRQKGQQSGADLVCPVAQDICPRMGKIVVEGGKGGFWEVSHGRVHRLSRGPLIAGKQ
jgi:hypothetical protein